MKRNVDCVGFQPTEKQVAALSDALGELQYISPYDSYVNACLQKKRETYAMTVSINYIGGQFSGEVENKDLEQIIRHGFDGIIEQLKIWQETRFEKKAA